MAQGGRSKITWGGGAAATTVPPPHVAETHAALQEERTKHQKRADKFGVEYQPPEQRRDLRHEARKERLLLERQPLTSGVDLFSQEEAEKRRSRAERFGVDSAPGWEAKLTECVAEEAKRKARADKFGTQYTAGADQALMDVDVLEGRKDVALEVARREEVVHVFGVDVMSTTDVLQYFSEYRPLYVEWINDSACNVLFGDANTVKRLLVHCGSPLPAEEQMAALDLADLRSMLYMWYRGQDFVKGGTPVPLLYRVATVEDVKPPPSKEHVTRRLWQAVGGRKGGRGSQKRRHSYEAEEAGQGQGDEEDMEEGEGSGRRRKRGHAARERRRTRRQLQDGTWVTQDIEMDEVQAEDQHAREGVDEAAEPVAPRPFQADDGTEMADLRQLLTSKKGRQRDDDVVGGFRADALLVEGNEREGGLGGEGGQRGVMEGGGMEDEAQGVESEGSVERGHKERPAQSLGRRRNGASSEAGEDG